MPKKILVVILVLCPILKGFSLDTLFTNPNYPPIVYTKSEYNFYKYTPTYAPSSLFHAFKILGTTNLTVLEQFKKRSVVSVMSRGIYYPSARLRKEFCLEGYSDFVLYFHHNGIYAPKAMESYILLAFHQYLNQEKIKWVANKKLALEDERKTNRWWKRRKRKLFKRKQIKTKEAKEKKKEVDKSKTPDELFWQEFGE